MKKILTWTLIAAILTVDGFMQDQTDTSVSLLGEHMDAINAKLADDASTIASQTTKIVDLTTRAEAAETALVNAAKAQKTAEDALTALQSAHATTTQELAAANLKLSKRPTTETSIIPVGGAPDKTIKANEMDFQKELFAALDQYGTGPKKATT